MEEGRSKVIIDRLISMVENGQNVTFSSGKVAVNKDETILLLKELDSLVTNELRVYREVNDRKGRIINEAKKEAEDIIYEAEQTASRIRVTKRISNIGGGFREDGLAEEEKMALRTAHDIYAASVIYTDEMLTEVTDVVAEAYDIINNQYGRMVNVLEEKARMIADNKAELMAGLRELSKEDRYSQIMELSQLLANELYNEKHRRSELEEYAAAQYEDIMNSDSAFNMSEDYDATTDSAFGEGVAEYDEYEDGSSIIEDTSVEASNQESVTEEASNEVSEGKITENPFDELKDKDTVARMAPVEKKILEKTEPKDIDEDGVRLLHPVNQYENKKDPIANTLNMFKRSIKEGEK